MKDIDDLEFGFSDAENYKRRENKQLFNQLFLRNSSLERVMDPSTTFLVGDKGLEKPLMQFSWQLMNTKIRHALLDISEKQNIRNS